MWRSRMFWQLFGASGVLILFSVGLLGYLAGSQVERNELDDLEERLRAKAILLQEVIRGRDVGAEAESWRRLQHLSKSMVHRVTLIDKDGQVLGETDKRAELMENHKDRPEVATALQHGSGKAVRHSASVDREMMYLAIKADLPGSPIAVVRLALPLDGVRSKVAGLRRLVWTAAGLTALFALAIAFWLARRITRPVHDLTQGAERIAAGAYGHRVYVESRDEVGQLSRSFNHMSERLAAQFAQLDEDRQQLRTVLGSMVEGVVAIDSDQRILFANDRAGAMLDFPNRSSIGRYFWELVRQRPIHELVRLVMEEGDCPAPEVSLVGPDARSIKVHVARFPGSRGAVLVFHDITALRKLERLRQEFVANVSHELKTPLAIIQACVETLIDGAQDDPKVRSVFLDRIADQAGRLHNLILDLLHLARIESETEVFTFESLDLEVSVHECLERHRTLAEGRRQRLEPVFPPEGECVMAWADDEAVRQILDNLVDNALKYTPEGGGVQVAWGRDGDHVFFQVADTGIGIAEADLPRIFERFYRVDRARSRELGGTGLGLSIVKHLTQAMRGTVTATSTLGQGTTFTVRLPAAKPSEKAVEAVPGSPVLTRE